MTAIEILKCQDDIVTTLASAIRNPWRLVAVNIEIDILDGDQAENYVALSYTRKFWRFIWRSEELPREVSHLFVTLRSMMESEDASPWGSCTLAFDKTGRYRFEYSYDKPPRLNGIHDDKSMMLHFDPTAFLDRLSA